MTSKNKFVSHVLNPKKFADTRCGLKYWLILSMLISIYGVPSQAGIGDLIVRMKGLLRPKATQAAGVHMAQEALVFSAKSKRFIEEVGQDLTAKARNNPDFGNINGRMEDIKQMIPVLLTQGDVPNNILIKGPTGSGKSVLIAKLAHLIAIKSNQIPVAMHDYRIIEIDVISFTKKSMQEQITALKEFINENPKIILFFDEMQTLTEVSKNGADENWVKNMLPLFLGTTTERRVPFIGATMDKSVNKITSIEGMSRRIQLLNFEPVSSAEYFHILCLESERIQKQTGVYISQDVIKDALVLSARFNKEIAEPGATKEILNKVASSVKIYGSTLQNKLSQIDQQLTILQSQKNFISNKKGPFYLVQKFEIDHKIKRINQLRIAIEQKLQKITTSNRTNIELISSYIQYQTKISAWLTEVTTVTNPNVNEIRQTFASWDKKLVTQLSPELQMDYSVLSQAREVDPELLVALKNFKLFFADQVDNLIQQTPREGVSDQVWMTTEDLISFFNKQSKINPEILLTSLGKSRKLVRNFESLARQDIFEQSMMSEVLTQHLFKISKNRQNLSKPAGRFLFVGASGSGKTLAAETISQSVFGRQVKVFDMSAYQDSFSKSKLVGSPAGYIGYDAEPELFKHLRLFPDSVVIFDNIELAHPEVIKVIENLLNQKTFTSASDLLTVDLTRAIFVLTTRVGDNAIVNPAWSLVQKQNHLKSQLFHQNPQIFSSGLMSQLDGVIKFELLSPQGLSHLMLKSWKNRQLELRKTQEIDVEISPEVFKFFFSQGQVQVDDLKAFLDEVETLILKADPPKGSIIDVKMQGQTISVEPATAVYQAANQDAKSLKAAWRLRQIEMSEQSWIQQLPSELNSHQPLFDPSAVNNVRHLQNEKAKALSGQLPTQTQPVRQ